MSAAGACSLEHPTCSSTCPVHLGWPQWPPSPRVLYGCGHPAALALPVVASAAASAAATGADLAAAAAPGAAPAGDLACALSACAAATTTACAAAAAVSACAVALAFAASASAAAFVEEAAASGTAFAWSIPTTPCTVRHTGAGRAVVATGGLRCRRRCPRRSFRRMPPACSPSPCWAMTSHCQGHHPEGGCCTCAVQQCDRRS